MNPVAEAVPRMLFSSGGRLVLADPALRTQHNRRIAVHSVCAPSAAVDVGKLRLCLCLLSTDLQVALDDASAKA